MIKTKLFFHSDKGENYDFGDRLGLKDKALDAFAYAGYEVHIDVEVDEKTGECFATHFMGVPLPKKVSV